MRRRGTPTPAAAATKARCASFGLKRSRVRSVLAMTCDDVIDGRRGCHGWRSPACAKPKRLRFGEGRPACAKPKRLRFGEGRAENRGACRMSAS
jgi:hypothetical protein